MASEVSISGVQQDLLSRVAELERDLGEAQQREAATAELLQVINRSQFALQSVFEAIAQSAMRLCEGEFAFVMRFDGELLRFAASYGLTPEGLAALQISLPRPAGDDTANGRAVLRRAVVQIPDVQSDPAYGALAVAQKVTYRSLVAVPLMRHGAPIGGITVGRARVGPFSEGQIRLLRTFAAQGVIAIENTRLFEEVQARTTELGEALEQQTASSEVLSVISSSPRQLEPVFKVILQNATRLCDAKFGTLFLREGDAFRAVATHNAPPAFVEAVARDPLFRPPPDLPLGRVAITRQAAQADLYATQSYIERHPFVVNAVELAGYRIALAVPMLKDDELIGSINVLRQEVQPFTPKQIELVKSFADQAVIAIENSRLFEAEQASKRELQESLEYQTATSEVLNVISRSPTDAQPVFDAIAESARRLCDGYRSAVYRFDGTLIHHVAHNNWNREGLEALHHIYPRPPSRETQIAQAILDNAVVHVPDLEAPSVPEQSLTLARALGYRSILAVPMLKDGKSVGAIAIVRTELGPFSERQIELVKTFADQAVIAIENTRLFEEVQQKNTALTSANVQLSEALEQQTATSEILSVIAASPTDVQPVFETIAKSAAKLCGAELSVVCRYDGELIHVASLTLQSKQQHAAFERLYPRTPDGRTPVARAILERRTQHVADTTEDPAYADVPASGFRSALAVPMLREGLPIGAVAVGRTVRRAFSQGQIALLQTFADQAVIAIENTRLFEEVQARTNELARSVRELKSLSAVAQAVSSSLELKVVLARILEHACAMSDSGGGAIYVYDKARCQFYLEAGHNMSEELSAAVREHPIRLGESVVGQCVERRQSVQIDDLATAPPHPLYEMHLRAGVRALLAVPLLRQEEVVGALVVRRQHAGIFADETLELLQAFADQSAIALENARLFEEIAQKSRELEIASQHKSQFVANMSHELRTPLAAILGYAELLQEGFYEPLGRKSLDALARIRSNGKHLLGLINTVLDIAKIESGQFTLNMAEYAIESVVETVRSASESLAQNKKLAFKTEVAKSLPICLGDEQRLTQVLLNLVGNALKFTDVGEVRIAANAADGHFELQVSDTGPGIPPEECERIFEKFRQVDSSNTRAKGGTGLGLAIAREIVEMHGGRIWVESTPGRGSTFQMELPTRAEFRKRPL